MRTRRHLFLTFLLDQNIKQIIHLSQIERDDTESKWKPEKNLAVVLLKQLI